MMTVNAPKALSGGKTMKAPKTAAKIMKQDKAADAKMTAGMMKKDIAADNKALAQKVKKGGKK